MAYLVLVRHGKSEWNALGKWTGFTDVSLDQAGREEARRAAEAIRDIPLDCAFVSDLKRAQETLAEMSQVLNTSDLPVVIDSALKERDYGAYTGKNKWEVQKEIGDEAFQRLRRGWDEPVPQGETLKDVYARVVPCYTARILPELEAGKNVLVVAHGNSLRALVKYLEHVPDEQVAMLEIATGEVYVYTIDAAGQVAGKDVRATHSNTV